MFYKARRDMLTYTLDRTAGPLYEALYRGLRADILAGRLAPGGFSKRSLADHLKISKVTVETTRPVGGRGYPLPGKGGLFCRAVERGPEGRSVPHTGTAEGGPETPWEADSRP